MSERVVLTRHLEMQRGGMRGNQAAPVITIYAQNGSGGAVARGDIVIWDKDSSTTADKISFTTTTVENNPDVLGMVYDTSIASAAFGKVQIFGPTDALKVDGTDDIAIGNYISTFSTAKIGQKTTGAGSFAMALEAYATDDSSGVIDAFINCLGGAFGGAASVSWYRDSVPLYFGDANDVQVRWDGTDLDMLPVADDTGAFNVGDGTTDFDVKVFLSASTKYVLFDVGNVLLTLEDVDLKLGDNDILQFGDATGGDIYARWDGTDLDILAAANDTGAINFGSGSLDVDVKIFLGATDQFVLFNVGDGNVDMDLDLGTVSGEEHGVDMAVDGTVSSGDSLVGLNVTTTPVGSAASWVSALYCKTTQASKVVNGYLCAAEFELASTAANASDNSVIVINSTSNHSGSPPAATPYITLREYGTTYANVFVRVFNDTGQSGTTDATTLVTTVGAAYEANCDYAVRIMLGSTPLWLLASSTAPS